MNNKYLPVLLIFFILISGCNILNPSSILDNAIAVYSGGSRTYSIINYKKHEIIEDGEFGIPDSFQILKLFSSEDRHNFVAIASSLVPNHNGYVVFHNIELNSTERIFPLGIDTLGTPKVSPAYIESDPNIYYLYTHLTGLHSFNIETQEVTLISESKEIPRYFYSSNTNEWIVLKNYYPESSKNYTDLEFYSPESRLNNYDFILNQNDCDSIDVMDLVFSEDNEILYFSYLISKRREVYQSAYFGAYDLNTRELVPSKVKLPWSDNPYYIEYNKNRDECYLIGAQGALYIIDVSSNEFKISDIILLYDKIPSPSQILITPDGNYAYISCPLNNQVFVIDLKERVLFKKIDFPHPYFLFQIDKIEPLQVGDQSTSRKIKLMK